MGRMLFCLVVFLFFLSDMVLAQTPTPFVQLPELSQFAKNQIQELKKMKLDLDAKIKSKKLKKQSKDTGDEGELAEGKSLYTDSSGTVRAYFTSGGDGDMVISGDYYYDAEGRLRVVLSHFGHYALGTQDQTIYLDPQGKVLRVYLEKKMDPNPTDWNVPNWKKAKPEKEELSAPKENPSGNEVELVTDPKKEFARPLGSNN